VRFTFQAGVLALAAAAGGGGCALRPHSPMTGQAAKGVPYPFAPASLSVHPLTRVDRDAAGKLWIICHLELRDAWGDPCKATGALQVQLYRPVGARSGGLGVQELAWDVNLSDLERNASLYDPATRTYRLPLEDAPAWLAASTRDREVPVARLRAVLTTTGARGEERVLEDEFALGG
jgi:hypothetical protein